MADRFYVRHRRDSMSSPSLWNDVFHQRYLLRSSGIVVRQSGRLYLAILNAKSDRAFVYSGTTLGQPGEGRRVQRRNYEVLQRP